MESRHKPKISKPFRQRNSGQIVVEYVLLLVIAVGIAIVITTTMVSRSPEPENQGFLVAKWNEIITAIGADMADDIEP